MSLREYRCELGPCVYVAVIMNKIIQKEKLVEKCIYDCSYVSNCFVVIINITLPIDNLIQFRDDFVNVNGCADPFKTRILFRSNE